MAKKKYYQRPDGLFETTRTLPNGKKKRFRGRTCKEVDAKILAYQEEQDNGRLFEEIAREWWADLLEHGTVSTTTTYKAYYKRLLEHFSGYRIGNIRTMDIQRFLADQAKKGYAYYTLNTQQNVINGVFGYALRNGDLEINPAVGVKKPPHLSKTVRPPLTEEQERIAKAAKGPGADLAQWLLYTGMRVGELMALRWEDVDRKNGVIHVTKKINYASNNAGRLEDHLKSENGERDIPIFDDLKPLLRRGIIGYVFSRPDGKNLSKSQVTALWGKFCVANGLTGEDGKPVIVPHQMRHCFATVCYESGASIKSCAQWMGDTEAVAARIYQALRPSQEQSDIDKVNEYQARRAAKEA